MGAFFLYDKSEQFDVPSVKGVFKNMGLGDPNQFILGDMILWIFKKELIKTQNFHHSSSKSEIYVTGTLVYRGKSYADSMIALLEDYENNSIDVDELIGGFCVIFYKDNHIKIMRDRADTYHVFTNHSKRILSSSFSATVKSTLHKIKINKLSGLEYVTTGYVIGPDTLLDDVYLINKNFEKNLNNSIYSFFPYPEFNPDITYCKSGFHDCVDINLKRLQKYWKDIGPLTREYGVEQGLSGGYDTRLIVLLSKALPVKISAHTHLPIDKRHLDVEYAKVIAQEMGIDHVCIPVTPTNDLKIEEAEHILLENLFWHDARTPSDIIRHIRSKQYRIKGLANKCVSLSGVGGEIYRNYMHCGPSIFSFENFLKLWVLRSDADFVIKNNLVKKDLINNIIKKASKILKISESRYINRLIAHRYYAEIRLPYWNGCKVSYENKLSFFLSPFSEYKISRESYKIIPHIGYGGKFEAAMIERLDPKIASLPNNYGANFVNESLKSKIRSFLLAYTPNPIINHIIKRKELKSNQISPLYSNLHSRVKSVQDAFQLLMDIDIPLNWDKVKSCPRIVHAVTNYGYILNSFSNKISFDN